jgi:hypothetical protein
MEDQATYRRLAVICAIICAGSLGPYLFGLHGNSPFLLDANGLQLGRDFINTWFYGQAFWTHDPGRFYDQDVYERAIQASRRWRVLFAAAGGVVAIVAVSVAVNGTETWLQFITKGLPAQAADMRMTMAALGQVSVAPASAMLLTGIPGSAVAVAQAGLSVLAAVLVAYAGYHAKAAGPEREALIFLSSSVFATPYLLAHDLTAVTAGAVLFALVCDPVRGKTWLLFVLFMPSIQLAFGAVNVHAAFLIPVTFALWQTARLRTIVNQRAAPGAPRLLPMIVDVRSK